MMLTASDITVFTLEQVKQGAVRKLHGNYLEHEGKRYIILNTVYGLGAVECVRDSLLRRLWLWWLSVRHKRKHVPGWWGVNGVTCPYCGRKTQRYTPDVPGEYVVRCPCGRYEAVITRFGKTR